MDPLVWVYQVLVMNPLTTGTKTSLWWIHYYMKNNLSKFKHKKYENLKIK